LAAVLPLISPPFMVNVPLFIYASPPLLELLLPFALEPLFIARFPPLFTVTSEALLLVRPRRVIFSLSVNVTPFPMVKSEPLALKLTVLSASRRRG
jgi:hypothetical protein